MAAETLAFKTELKQLLQLIIHSLYSHPDIFLRELISNASDAIDTARFQSLTNQDLLEGNSEWSIRIVPNSAERTLTISDNGIGMSRETIVENLGTIARSGTKAFIESLKSANAQQRPELIGQFGVGFYSAFMVADRVTVLSRMAGSPEEGVRWESDGQGEFRIEAALKEKRGTDIVLHLKEDAKQFLDPYRLRTLVKKYSDFVEHPIVLVAEKDGATNEETINARKAIWLRNKSEVKEDEYLEFYKHLTHDHDKPLKTIHFSAEGQVEFKALLFVPSHRPFDLMWGDSDKGLHLYIQRVFIMDDCEALLPRWLRFLRGVVDSPDLPLNVSREILQQSAPLEKIKSNLVMKAIASLDEVRRQDPEKYLAFYRDLGVFVKEGAYQDFEHREKVADLLLFDSTKTEPGKLTALSDYVERMLSDQSEMLYLAGESREILLQSPHLEAFRAKGQEVLLLTDPADEIVIDAVRQYKGKSFKAINKGVADAAVEEEAKTKYKPLLDLIQSKLPQIKEARLTNRLKESAVCLTAEDSAFSANVQRLMQRMGQAAPEPEKRVLEVNPEHPLIQAIESLRFRDANDARLETACRLLYDEALIAEGSKVQDPAEFARRMNEMAVRSLQ
jgi:molecular chaperone HtpG